jgi:hypothetical protein
MPPKDVKALLGKGGGITFQDKEAPPPAAPLRYQRGSLRMAGG